MNDDSRYQGKAKFKALVQFEIPTPMLEALYSKRDYSVRNV